MHESCIPSETLAIVDGIAPIAGARRLALGGGTACALRLGYRISRDLDFFGLDRIDTSGLLEDLATLDEPRLRGISDDELALVLRGVEISATSLGRETLGPPEPWRGLDVLSGADLAELKVHAAVSRGMVRDLCDLHLLCLAGEDLEKAVHASPVDVVVALKALTDAERFAGQPALDLRVEWNVDQAVAFFEQQARRILGG